MLKYNCSLSDIKSYVKNHINKCDTIEKLEEIIQYCYLSSIGKLRKFDNKKIPKRPKLREAVSEFIVYVNGSDLTDKYNIWYDIIPKIVEWAVEHDSQVNLPKLNDTATFYSERDDILHIIANMFICNVKDIKPENYDERTRSVSLIGLYSDFDNVAKERVKCLLGYFYNEYCDELKGWTRIGIQYERYKIQDFPNWNTIDKNIDVKNIHIHSDKMEDIGVPGYVDFANKDIHIHSIISSATQEEVLFSCCPETYVSILMCPRLKDNEAVIMRCIKRHCDYTGYLGNFKFKGLHICKPNVKCCASIASIKTIDIIVIDAIPKYDPSYYIDKFRDINKCYAGFSSYKKFNKLPISTGAWGCGAFGGDFHLKFIEQIIISSYLDIKLYYSCYQNQKVHTECERMLNIIKDKKLNMADLAKLVANYNPNRNFYNTFIKQ